MYPRLKLLKAFLREDGFICCQINDDEGAYLKVIMDEIFSRTNYISTMFIQVRCKRKNKSPFLGIYEGTAYALLYNGILGDKSVSGGNVLTHATLNHIMHDIDMAVEDAGGTFEYHQLVIYGEATRLTHVSLKHKCEG
jgi:adenine-specific DNA-methyltransferase